MVDPYTPDALALILTLEYPASAIPQFLTTSFALLSIETAQLLIVGMTLSGTVTVKVAVDVVPTCPQYNQLLYEESVTVIVPEVEFGICVHTSIGITYPEYV